MFSASCSLFYRKNKCPLKLQIASLPHFCSPMALPAMIPNISAAESREALNLYYLITGVISTQGSPWFFGLTFINRQGEA